VPGLSKIPLLGELFKYHTKSRDRRSLIVPSRSSIVHSSEDTELIFQNAIAPPPGAVEGEVENLLNGTSAIGGQ
jgi:type II secretory pathway component GspD/PulD (secretin)